MANNVLLEADNDKDNNNNKNDDAYKNFINTVDSEVSKENYSFAFSKFMKFYGLEDYEKMLLFDRKKLEGLIRDYITHMKIDKKLSYNTVNLYVASISHFYQIR
jgi:hypothetical protein